MTSVKQIIARLQLEVARPYYFVILGLLTVLDAFVFFIPIDGLLVTSVFAHPKAWWRNALGVSIGSVTGAVLLAGLLEVYGLSFLHNFAPGLESSATWTRSSELMSQYGIFAILIVSITPIPQLPIIALAGFSHMPLLQLASLLFVGRTLKSLVVAWLAAKSPDLVNRIRGIQGEINEAKKYQK